ncbi:MAG: nidogen-like domain-containing protein, partial [Bacteroidota bacterium]
MKKNLLFKSVVFGSFLLFTISNAAAQQNIIVDSQQYQQLKMAGNLPQQVFNASSNNNTLLNLPVSNQAATVSTNSEYNCNCLIPLDTTFSIVPFANSTPPYYTNDDGSTSEIALPFSFCYYGQQVSSIYINNNGNISFSNPYSTFSADAFPSQNFNMIAPFWGDVDTRGQGGGVVLDSLGNPIDTIAGEPYLGLVYYKITPSALIIKWEEVGYFSMQG